MLFALLVIIHVMVSLALILVVLLQVGKGQSIGAAFGGAGSSQTFFGSRGPATFLSHLTTISAGVFMVTSLALAYMSSHQGQGSSLLKPPPAPESAPAPVTPAEPVLPTTPAPAPVAPAPTATTVPESAPVAPPAPVVTPSPTQEAPAVPTEKPAQEPQGN